MKLMIYLQQFYCFCKSDQQWKYTTIYIFLLLLGSVVCGHDLAQGSISLSVAAGNLTVLYVCVFVRASIFTRMSRLTPMYVLYLIQCQF